MKNILTRRLQCIGSTFGLLIGLSILSGCVSYTLRETEHSTFQKSERKSSARQVKVVFYFFDNLKYFDKSAPDKIFFLEDDIISKLNFKYLNKNIHFSNQTDKNGSDESSGYRILITLKRIASEKHSSFLISLFTLGFYPYEYTDKYLCEVELLGDLSKARELVSKNFNIDVIEFGPLPNFGTSYGRYGSEMVVETIKPLFDD